MRHIADRDAGMFRLAPADVMDPGQEVPPWTR
jgi:hypothetical protein